MTDGPRLVTQAEYARRRGITRQAVHKAIALGKIKTVGKKIELSSADQEWFDNTDPSQMRLIPDPSKGDAPLEPPVDSAAARVPAPGTVYGEKARHEGFKASLTQLELEERAGRLTEVEGVRAEQFDVARTVRDAILNMPSELAPRLAAQSAAAEIECRIILEEYANGLCNQLADAAEGSA